MSQTIEKTEAVAASGSAWARSIHDRVLPSLRSAEIRLDQIRSKFRSTDDLKDIEKDIAEARSTLRFLLGELRSTGSGSLNMYGELSKACEQLRPQMQVVFDFQTDYSLDLELESELVCIATEAIENVRRHANATLIQVGYNNVDGNAVLEIIDNGAGFDPADVSETSFGILGMRERAQQIESQIVISSTLGKGTVVQCTLTIH